MAFHSKKEFADLCGMPKKSLAVYIVRGKVIVGANDLIDDQVAENKMFRDNHEVKKPKKQAKPRTETVGQSTPADGHISTLREKAVADLENKKILNELKRLEIQKKLGQVVPTEDVKQLLVMHSENIKGAYMEASDNLIVIFANKGGMNANDISEMRKKFTDLVNGAIDKSVNGTKSALRNVIEEFSEKRGVGQHD